MMIYQFLNKLHFISTNINDQYPAKFSKFACVDFKSSFAGLSIYHINDEIYDSIHDQTEIYVADPKVKTIKLQLGPENVR